MILALSGKSKSGKDTLYEIAKPFGWARLAFADPLKERVRNDLGLTLAHTDGALKEEPSGFINNCVSTCRLDSCQWTPRQIMIEYGQFFRQFEPLFWVKQVVNKIKQNPTVNYIITDCRFPNEIEALRNIGAFTIRLERHQERDSMVSEGTQSNISETALDNRTDWDFKLEAEDNHTPEDLKRFFNLVLDQIGRKV